MKQRVLSVKTNIHRLAPSVVLRVVYDLNHKIHSIHVFSDYFDAFVPVDMQWLIENFPRGLETVRDAVDIEIHRACFPQSNNGSDPTPAA